MKESELQNIKQRFGIIGNSPLLNSAIRRAVQVAPTEMSVLITGESGSGKESFSKIIHSLSPRKHGQFIAINCGAIPEGTIYSELFGHEKGSFTGSTDMRKGFFETADGGTIFLDEIGEMPVETQAMLLRVLENGEFIRMGSSKPLKTNVRVIAATNVNLDKALETRKFREDLYYRLNTVPIYVPPLRERGNDVLLLFRKFTVDFSEKYHEAPINLLEDAKQMLLKFRFPGNIRQLKNLAEQISLLENENRDINVDILAKYLPVEQRNQSLMLFSEPLPPQTHDNFNNFSEREILYKLLFDMRKDVNELKKLVLQLLQNGTISHETIQNHQDLFENIDLSDFKQPNSEALMLKPNYTVEKNFIEIDEIEETENHTIHDIQHEIAEEDILSLQKKEKELILKALVKNKNKRKYAAQDLGISERTLYRKIKEYEIEK